MSHCRYVFRGYIKSLLQRDALWQSRFNHQYLVFGKLWYQHRMRDGALVEIDIEEEHTGLQQADEQDDDESLMEDEAQADDDAAAAKHAEHEDLVQQRRACALIIQDRGKLPLPHAGMAVSLLLHRTQSLPQHSGNSALTYRDYLYTVVYVKSWKCTSELKTPTLKAAFCDIEAALSADRTRYEQTTQLAAAGTLSKSAVARQSLNNMSAFVVPDPVITADLKVLATGDKTHTMQLRTLCTGATRSAEFVLAAIHTFGNAYALGQCHLHGLLPGGASSDKLANELRLDGATVHDISAAELAAIGRMRAGDTPLPTQLFFGARDALPLFAASAAVSQWQGVQWFAARDKKLTAGMRKYLKAELPSYLSKSVTPEEVLALAHSLHCEQQVWWRSEQDMFDATPLLAAVQVKSARRQKESAQAEESEAEEEGAESKAQSKQVKLVKAAIALLVHAGVWHNVPVQTKRRLRAMQQWRRTPDGSLWFCTERRYALVSAVASHALRLMPHITLTYGTGQPIAPAANALYVYSGPEPSVVLDGGASDSFLLLPLYVLLERQQYTENDDFFVCELLAFRRVVLCDAHLLDMASLAQLMSLIVCARALAPDVQFEMHGDPILNSPFRDMVRSLCFRCTSHADVSESLRGGSSRVKQVFDEHLQMFSGELAPARQHVNLIQACYEASLMTKSDIGRQSLAAALVHFAVREQRDTVQCLARQLLQDSVKRERAPARWLLLCSSYREAGAALYPQLAEAAGSIKAEWSEALRRHFCTLANTPQRAAEFVCFVSPYVGYQRQCVRVLEFYAMICTPPESVNIQKVHCHELDTNRHTYHAAVSLDCAQLYLALELRQFSAIDHRVCCHTWAENIISVARHRHELCSQSFVMARDALPFNALRCQIRKPAGAMVLCGVNFRFEDVYRTFAQASVWDEQAYCVVNLDRLALPAQLSKRYPEPNTFLGDLLRAGVLGENEEDEENI